MKHRKLCHALIAALAFPGMIPASPFELDADEAASGQGVHSVLDRYALELGPEDAALIEESTGTKPTNAPTPEQVQNFWFRDERFPSDRIQRMSTDELRAAVAADEGRPLALQILVDGLGGKYLERYLYDDGFRATSGALDLPTMRELFFEKGKVVDISTASTPTISTRNIAILSSGLNPGDSGEGNGQSIIPNFTYLDREKNEWFYFWGTDGLHLNGLLQAQGKTVFQRVEDLETFSFGAIFHEGADTRYSIYVGEVLRRFKRGFQEQSALKALRKKAEREKYLSGLRREVIEAIDGLSTGEERENQLRSIRRKAQKVLNSRSEGLPDLVFWFNPWVDHQAHSTGAYSPEVIQDMMPELDNHVGQLLEIYRDPGLSAAARENLLVGLVSDHGHTVIQRNFSVESVFEAEKIPFEKISVDEGANPVISIRKKALTGKDVVIGSTAGGSFVIDLFDIASYGLIEGKVDPENLVDNAAWKTHPTFSTCRDYPLFDGRRVDFIEVLRKKLMGVAPDGSLQNILDYMVLRDDGHTHSAPRVRVMSPTGDARIERKQESGGTLVYRYTILEGECPLGFTEGTAKEMAASGKWFTGEAWQQATASTQRPDAVYQLAHLYDLESAGTINLFPARNWSISSTVPGRHAGELFEEKNSTQLFGGPAVKSPGRIPTARGGCLPVTMIHHLQGDSFEAGEYDYPSLLDQLK